MSLNRKGQLAVFVVVAILLIGAILLIFVFRDNLFGNNIPAKFHPLYQTYDECIEREIRIGLSLMGTQGGKLDVGEYVPGSEFAPFSSHLNFLGISVPYWYYVSGNNIIQENIPKKEEMEIELENYLEERLNECEFEEYYEQGYYVDLPESANADVSILDGFVRAKVEGAVVVTLEEESARKVIHEVEIESNFGELYKTSLDIYNKQAEDAFLEEYSVDVLRSYAPVDGVEVTCAPKVWNTGEVIEELKKGLEGNLGSIKFNGDYYQLQNDEDEYFVVDLDVDKSAQLLYSKNWPSKIEISPADEKLMIAKPIGNQEGLGVLGFCYAPYHFVYDLSFPVLVQVSDGTELFQFPVAVVIDNNLPREAELMNIGVDEPEYDVCQFKEGEIEVRTYDRNLNALEADVSYKCFDRVCNLGGTLVEGNEAVLKTNIPICVNGELVAKTEGYANERILFSSNSESYAEMILEKEYEIEVDLKIAGRDIGNSVAVVSFESEEGSSIAFLPDNNKLKLKEGSYDVSVYVYGGANVVIPSSITRQCYDAPRDGLLGIFGSTTEECVEIEVPPVEIDSAIIGGGKSNTYILESELRTGRVVVDTSELPKANSLEQLQYNFEVFDSLGIDMEFGR